jgi:putative ABC transport system substrate-binding protein
MLTATRREVLGALVGAASLPAASPSLWAQEAASFPSWVSIPAQKLGRWKLSRDDDPLRCSLVNASAEDRQRFTIVVLFPRRSSAYDIALATIIDYFDRRGFVVEFDLINFEQKDVRGAFALQEAARKQARLIFAMGSEATDWLWRNARDTRIPVVTVCSKDPVLLQQMASYEVGSGVNFAFTSLNLSIAVQIAYLRELSPQLRNIAVLVDRHNISAMETQALPFVEMANKLGLNAFLVAIERPDRAAAELASMLPTTVRQMRSSEPALTRNLFWITGSTSIFSEIATINSHADRIPVLSVVPDVVRPGADSAVMSIGVSFESNARLAAVYATNILEGRTTAGVLKVGVLSPPDIAINFLRARQIGLKIPFRFFELAEDVYGPTGASVRRHGATL